MTATLAWAWAQRAGDPAAKAVLVALGHYAEGGMCWAKLDALARATELTELAVSVAFDELEGRGLISRTIGTDRNGREALVIVLRLPEAATG